jgi:hypothetical protein
MLQFQALQIHQFVGFIFAFVFQMPLIGLVLSLVQDALLNMLNNEGNTKKTMVQIFLATLNSHFL